MPSRFSSSLTSWCMSFSFTFDCGDVTLRADDKPSLEGGRLMRKLAVALLVALIALCLAVAVPDPAYACRDYDGHHNSNVVPDCGGATGSATSLARHRAFSGGDVH